jgi:hypothetical protein
MRQIAIAACLALFAGTAAAATDPANEATGDADALSLADETKDTARSSREWRVFAEGALARSWLRGTNTRPTDSRLSLDLHFDSTIAPAVRAILSDRLDLMHSSAAPRETNVNTLREAYLSWHARPDLIGDLGRVNLRYGAAFGYNPTDFFKAGALRSVVSPDPVSLRENRQGTFVVQGQKLWSGGSLTGLYSPRLARHASESTFSLDAGATNPRNRWLIAGSHKVADAFSPQVLLHGGTDTPTQVGLNISSLLNDATVAFLEFSTGKGRTLVADALGTSDEERTQRRAAVGMTYTTAFNLSFTAEAEYNSAAPDRRQWESFSSASPGNALRLLGTSEALQELAVRRALFFYAAWRDVGMRNLDVTAFMRRDMETRSRAHWIEARYRWAATELALQWQLYTGDPGSLYGSVPEPRRIELLLRYFF